MREMVMPELFNQIDVVVLCGGQGTRLRPTIGETQKAMVPIHGEPFLNYQLKFLKQQGFGRVILCTGYQSKSLEDYYSRESFDLQIVFSREEISLGTGGAVKHARPLIQSGMFLVMNGDSLCRVDLRKLIDFHMAQKAIVTLVAAMQDERNDAGTVLLDGLDQVVEFVEKPGGNTDAFINGGIYCMSQIVFNMMPKRAEFSLERDFFPKITGQGFYGLLTGAEVVDIGTPERLKEAAAKLKDI